MSFNMNLASLIVVVLFALLWGQADAGTIFTDNLHFPLDSNGRLRDHWLVYSNNPECETFASDLWRSGHENKLRSLAAIDGKLAEEVFARFNSSLIKEPTTCYMACLDRGASTTYLSYPFPEKTFDASDESNDGDAEDWLRKCQTTEIGFISYHNHPINLFWIDSRGRQVPLGEVKYGEKNVLWQVSTLGHVFKLEDAVTGVSMGTYVAEFHGCFPLGGTGGSRVQPQMNNTGIIKRDIDQEFDRAHIVKRTFTELGFKRSRLPNDVWASMSAYYYNNRNNFGREEWDEKKGYYVNWWEKDAYFVNMPWDLKRYWQKRLQTLVEAWVGVELEMTDIYGMRRYEEGARLLTHVDRTSTHATSLIINVAQQNIREPWKVEIYDHADRLHEVEMQEGDIVYYESARCLHGRMRPLKGDFYVNLFSHYRPKGDDQWYTRPNPPTATKPLLDIGECSVTDGGSVHCTKNGDRVPSLSPSLQTLRRPEDLFEWWKKTAPEVARTVQQQLQHGEGVVGEEMSTETKDGQVGTLSSRIIMPGFAASQGEL